MADGMAQIGDSTTDVPSQEPDSVTQIGDKTTDVPSQEPGRVTQIRDSTAEVPIREPESVTQIGDSTVDVPNQEPGRVTQIGDSTSDVPNQETGRVTQIGDSTSDVPSRKPTVHILVVSDVVCPWCWIAKRRLENAMESLQEKLNFDVQFSPFLLRPKCSREGVPNSDYNSESPRLKNLREVGNNLDMEINLSCPIVPYSVPALTLRQYVRESDQPKAVQNQVTEKLYEAYFTKGLALTRKDLLDIARELMLDLDKVAAYLDDPENETCVLDQAESWRNQGVQAVPFFFMNGKAACSGAQDTEDFVKTILKVAERFPADMMEDASGA